MRKSSLAVAINLSFHPGVRLASSRLGPVPPYREMLNRRAYHELLGCELRFASSVGKSVNLKEHYRDRLY